MNWQDLRPFSAGETSRLSYHILNPTKETVPIKSHSSSSHPWHHEPTSCGCGFACSERFLSMESHYCVTSASGCLTRHRVFRVHPNCSLSELHSFSWLHHIALCAWTPCCLSICPPSHLSTHTPIHQPSHPSIYQLTQPSIQPPIHPPTFPCIHPLMSIHPPTYASLHSPTYPSININLAIHPFIHSLTHPSTHPTIHPSMHLGNFHTYGRCKHHC